MADFYEKFGETTAARAERVESGDLSVLRLEVHALAGEASLLGLRTVANAATELEQVARRLANDSPEAALSRARGWFEQLAEAARRAAAAGDDDPKDPKLKALRAELGGTFESEGGWFQAPEGASPVSGGESDHTARRVLLLDDSEITREAFGAILEEEGYHVASAGNLIEFEQQLAEFKPELVLSDINMPDIQGDEICRVLKTRFETEGIPIILISSLPDDELAVRAKSAGADGYVSKQHGPEQVVALLDDLLSQIIF